MKACYRLWSGKDLSFIGKILIAKAGGISSLDYSLTNAECKSSLIKAIQRETSKFICGNSSPNVVHLTIIQNWNDIGLWSPDIERCQNFLWLFWFSRIQHTRKWRSVLNKYLKPMGDLDFPQHCNCNVNRLKYIPSFCRELLQWFSEIFENPSKSIRILWNNKNILVACTSLYQWKCLQKGIRTILHLKDKKNIFSHFIN